MNIFGLNISRSKPTTPSQAPRQIVVVNRGYAAAEGGRLFADWKLDNGYEPRTIAKQLPTMVGRSREQSKNNPWVRKLLSMYRLNVVGHTGFRFRATATDSNGTLDEYANRELEREFRVWRENPLYCDASGRKTFRDICNLATTALVRDGEDIVRLLPGHRWPENPYAFSLKMYCSTAMDTSLVSDGSRDGRTIINGVEIDTWGRPLGYWFRKDGGVTLFPSVIAAPTSAHEYIPAEQIVHIYAADWEDQYRGIPWLYSTLPRLKHLDGYEEAELVAAREDACSTGQYAIATGADYEPGDNYDKAVASLGDVAPGTREILPEGVTFTKQAPTRPNGAFPDFDKAMLRGVASGGLVDYNTLSNDLEGVSFSSIRQGVLSWRDAAMDTQQLMIDHLCKRVYLAWLGIYLTTGRSNLPFAKLGKFAHHEWRGRRWMWVDPRNDAQSNEIQRKYGWKTDADITAEIGGDWEANAAETKRLEAAANGTYLEQNYAEAQAAEQPRNV